ncbi:hypothetical protein RRG08_011105 [Elysia crispata]|uniref:Uncharacterized protein n=1 Tax=Elysia crispata TaxID=231223 RepID=A0AAE1A0E7_9GAST|nr:hypothetical protein RRG08_011105 [Elysia crispata]
MTTGALASETQIEPQTRFSNTTPQPLMRVEVSYSDTQCKWGGDSSRSPALMSSALPRMFPTMNSNEFHRGFVSVGLGLVLVSHLTMFTAAMGIEPTHQNSRMLVVFDEKYEIVFSDELLEEFYSCLCNVQAVRCSFVFESSKNFRVVTAITKPTILSDLSNLAKGETVVCQTYLLSDRFDCNREALTEKSCSKSEHSGCHRLEPFDISCKKCINLCWCNFRTVRYNSTSTRAVPVEGKCDTSSIITSDLVLKYQSNTPDYSTWGEWLGDTPSTSLTLAGSSLIETTPSKQDNSSNSEENVSLSSPSEVSQNTLDSGSSTARSHGREADQPVVVWVILGSATILTVAVAFALVLCRKDRQRAEGETESKQHIYMQPPESSVEESSIDPGTMPMDNVSQKIFFINGKGFMAYMSPDSDYCTIVDSDITSANPSHGNNFQNLNGELRLCNSPTQNAAGKAESSSGASRIKAYLKPGNEMITSAAQAPGNWLESQREVRTEVDSDIGEAAVRLEHVYCRLNSRSELPADTQATYNVAASEFKKSSTEQDSLDKPVTSLNPYSLATAIHHADVAAESAQGINAWQAPTGLVQSESDADQTYCTEQGRNEYFLLENVGNAYGECLNRVSSLQEHHKTGYFVLENDAAKSAGDSLNMSRESECSMQDRGECCCPEDDAATTSEGRTNRDSEDEARLHFTDRQDSPVLARGDKAEKNEYYIVEHIAQSEQEHNAQSEQGHNAQSEQEHNAQLEQGHNAQSEQEHNAQSEQGHNAQSEQEHNAQSEQEHNAQSEQEHNAQSEQEHNAQSEQGHNAQSEQEHNAQLEQGHNAQSEWEHNA